MELSPRLWLLPLTHRMTQRPHADMSPAAGLVCSFFGWPAFVSYVNASPGQYAASGDRPRDPALSWHVYVALTAVVREHNELGRQVRGGIAPLLARIHQGYRAHPDVQAWAAAQELEEALRMAICLGSVD